MKGHKMRRKIKDGLKNEELTSTLRRQLGMKRNVMKDLDQLSYRPFKNC